jgi:LUD domain
MNSAMKPQTVSTVFWERLPGPETVGRTVTALKSNGFKAEAVPNPKAALERIRQLIPNGAQVMTGSSKTLEEIGLVGLLASGDHPWENMKAEIVSEKDRERQLSLRRKALFADYFLGSVQAVTTKGELIAGSASGSQLAAYAFGGHNLILVAGTNKITEDIEEGLMRLREHSVPLEDKRMKGLGFPGTVLSKVFIYEKERQRNVHVILVGEKLGF